MTVQLHTGDDDKDKIVLYQCAYPDDGPVRPKTCSWCIKTLL